MYYPQAQFNNRYKATILLVALLYLLLILRLILFGLQGSDTSESNYSLEHNSISRPDIVDRNGMLLARDIQSYSLFIQPKRMINVIESLKLIKTVLPRINIQNITKKLNDNASFIWISRNISQTEKFKIKALAIPGLGFTTENRRFYPNSANAAFVVGYVDIDNKGIAGIEKYIDSSLKDSKFADKAVQLALDSRVQTIMQQVLEDALQKYHAESDGAVILDANNGEVIAMSSLPGFNPTTPSQALQSNRLNRMSAGLYEMGSVMKVFTTAFALDSGQFNLDSIIDVSKPLEVGDGQYIHDFHGKNRPLTLWEIFIYSSNIGSAKEVAQIGMNKHRDFLKKMGLLSKLRTQLPEIARPVEPKKWKKVNSMTIAFGHGMMISPLQMATCAASLVNGGYLIQPTFLKSKKENIIKKRVIDEQISREMRYLLALNMKQGSGRFANSKYYNIGGKTGTAEKVDNGKYSKDKRFNSFLAVVPADKPRYIVLTIIDNPKAIDKTIGDTAGYNAATMAVEIINRCANLLGILPNNEQK